MKQGLGKPSYQQNSLPIANCEHSKNGLSEPMFKKRKSIRLLCICDLPVAFFEKMKFIQEFLSFSIGYFLICEPKFQLLFRIKSYKYIAIKTNKTNMKIFKKARNEKLILLCSSVVKSFIFFFIHIV